MPRTAAELLADLTEQGFSFEIRGDKIAVKPRPSPAIVAEVARHKPELIRLLSEGEAPRENTAPLRGERRQEPRTGKDESPPEPEPIGAQRANSPPIKKEKVSTPDLRAAWERLNEEKEARAARDSLEADRRREKARFEAARARWQAEDAAARAQRIDLLDRLMGTDDGPIDWRDPGY